ncbi:MAG: hypothetical protein M1815_003482 [Lichina confinis]|nr:MAG: hypothetical protein M1815_003482 [Lichina confinis]
MANANEIPWSQPEKVFLLTEILKDAQIPPEILLNIISELKIEPRWSEIPLPPGRSLRSCQMTFQSFWTGSAHPSLGLHHSGFAHTGSPNVIITSSGRKRKEPTARTLQPRPSAYGALNGDPSAVLQPTPGDDAGQPPRKKRGRPSRAEAEARAAAAAARGETYPPSKSPRTPKSAKGPGRKPTGAQEMPAQVAATATPAFPVPLKKRRGRPTKAEADAKRMLTEAGFLDAPNDSSTLATMGGGPDEDAAADADAVTGLVGDGQDVTGPGGIVDGGVPDVSTMGTSLDAQNGVSL